MTPRHECVVGFVADWTDPRYDDPPRWGWTVTCSLCGPLGKPAGWAYAKGHVACGVATRHEHRRNYAH